MNENEILRASKKNLNTSAVNKSFSSVGGKSRGKS
jgi:hypothetical protein